MDTKRAFEFIDESTLDTCRTLLAMSAPDLCDELSAIIRNCSDPSHVLSAARDLVKQAYLRENN